MLHDQIDVVVVDDQPDAANSMAEILRMDGYTVRTASDGREALALVGERVPMCVILDIAMPGMDGCELAQVLRRDYGSEMVLIAMTGIGDDSARVTRTISLVDHFLKKPVDYQQIKKLLPPVTG